MVKIATTLTRSAAFLFVFSVLLVGPVRGGPLDEMSIERWAKLKEAERYQLNVAEKYYRERQFKVAADEYEKFLKLYDRSEGAPYAQLKWSHCQVELRKLNTAIKDGYQSVLDYYPDSPEGPIAALMLGKTQSAAGDMKLAKKAYAKAIAAYPKHFAAVMARLDLVEIAKKEMDLPTQTALLQELAYNVERKGSNVESCLSAARLLAQLSFQAGNFDEGLKAIATTCPEAEVPVHLMHPSLGRLPQIIYDLTGAMDEPTKKLGEKLAEVSSAWLKQQALNGIKDEKTKAKAIETWYAVAEIRRHARQPDKQKAVFDELLVAIGVNDPLLEHFAQWYKSNKQMDKARLEYAKFKDATRGQTLLAASFEEENKFDKAVEIYQKLALAEPKTYAAWMNAAAMAYRRGGKPDQAIAVYTELLTKDAAQANEYHFQIAETLYHANRWKESITAYRGVEGHQPHTYQHMAAAYRQLKQYDEAIALYRQIMVVSPPTAPSALYHIGTTYEQWGPAHKEDAIKTFKQVCDKFPKSSEGSQAHSHLNEAYKITVTLGGAKD